MCVCKSLIIQVNRFNSLTSPIAIDVIVVLEDLTLAAGQLVQARTFNLTQTQISCLHVKANFPGRILFSRENFSSRFRVKKHLMGLRWLLTVTELWAPVDASLSMPAWTSARVHASLSLPAWTSVRVDVELSLPAW